MFFPARHALAALCMPLFILCTPLGSFADSPAADPAEVEWAPRWKTDDRFAVEMTKEETIAYHKGKPIVRKGSVRLDFMVKEKGRENDKDFYVLHCTFGKYEQEGPQKGNPLTAKMGNLTEGLCLHIKTGEDGRPRELLNADEIVEKIGKTIDAMEERLKESKMPESIIQRTVSVFRKTYKDPQSVRLMLLKELRVFFAYGKAKLKPGTPSESDDQIPNPFRPESFPARMTVTLASFDKETGIAVVECSKVVDKDKAVTVLKTTLENIPPGVPGPKEGEKPRLEITEKTVYRINTNTGWPISVELTYALEINGHPCPTKWIFKTLPVESP